MDEQIQTKTDEINIRELIEIIWRGKVIITVIMIVAILLSGVISFVVLPSTYEARTILLANPIDLTLSDDNLIGYMAKLPTMTIQTYLQQVLTPEVLNDTIQELNLRDNTGRYISSNSLRGRLVVNQVGDTNLMEIKVTDTDPVLTAKIANAMAESFIAYITNNTRRLGQQAVDQIGEQLKKEEENLNQKSIKLTEYWKGNRNIDVLKGEVDNLKKQLIASQDRLFLLNQLIAADRETLSLLRAEVDAIPELDLSDFWFGIEPDSKITRNQINIGLNTDNLSQALLRVEISKIQSRLIGSIGEHTTLIDHVENLNSALTLLQIELTVDEYKFNALNRDMQMAEQAYDAYQQQYRESMLTAASDIGKTSIIVTSKASEPESPISPNKMMNIILAAVLGFMLGVFITFFSDYWKRSKPVTN